MEDSIQGRAGELSEDTDTLLSTDMAGDVCVSGVSQSQASADRCDLLLDAIDVQLGHLQAQSHRVKARREERSCTRAEYGSTAHLSKSERTDTALGSSMLASDIIASLQSPAFSELPEPSSDVDEEGKSAQAASPWELQQGALSRTEQCRWRLECLLGSADTGFESTLQHGADSIRTEDFASRFREEMVAPLSHTAGSEGDPGVATPTEEELAEQEERASSLCPPLGGAASQSRYSGLFYSALSHPSRPEHFHQAEFAQESRCNTSGRGTREAPLPREGGAEHPAGHVHRLVTGLQEDVGILVCCDQEVPPKPSTLSALGTERPGVASGGMSSDTDLPFDPSHTPGHPSSSPPREAQSHVSTSPGRASTGKGDLLPLGIHCRSSAPLVCSDGPPPPGSAVGPHSGCGTDVVTVSRSRVNATGAQNDSSQSRPQSRARHLAGVPLRSFDSVNIDSDLDSVRTACVREHIRESLRHNAGDDHGSSSAVPSGNQSIRRSHHRRKASRRVKTVCPADEEDSDQVEEEDARSGRHFPLERDSRPLGQRSLRNGRPEGTGTDRLRRKEEEAALSCFRRDCRQAEERLRHRTAQLCEMELCLAALLKRKTVRCCIQHAVQELECLRAAGEGGHLEAGLRGCAAQVDGARSQLRPLQRQGDAYLHRARAAHMEKVSESGGAAASDCSCCVSLLEREELERQLFRAKAQLFAQQRWARHQLDSMQEGLEETKQELERRDDDERVLKERCTQLEEQLRKEQRRDEELRKLKATLEQQAKELQADAQEMVNKAKEKEQRRWEAEVQEAHRKCVTLEEQSRQAVEGAREEAQRERSAALGLRVRVVELQNCVQGLERELLQQQREQDSALRMTLTKEHRAELQRLRRHTDQERCEAVSQLQGALEQAEGRMHAMEEATARAEQQHRAMALEVGAECQHLQELLEGGGDTAGGAAHLQLSAALTRSTISSTVVQAVQTLRGLGRRLHVLVTRLRQELDAQRRANRKATEDKEQALRAQREQLTAQKEAALESLKDRLIQEHIQEIGSLQRTQLHDGTTEAGGLVAALRRRLRDKDMELQEVQMSMSRWKEQTAARLARKVEEELTAELERCKAELLKERRALRTSAEHQRKLPHLEKEAMRYASSPSLVSAEPCSSSSTPNLAMLKLLRHLQGHVRQLRTHSWAHTCSPAHLGPHAPVPRPTCSRTHLATAGNLAGSYLETMASRMQSVQASGGDPPQDSSQLTPPAALTFAAQLPCQPQGR